MGLCLCVSPFFSTFKESFKTYKVMANFKEIKVLNIEGQEELVDFSKQIGNAMYTQGKDVDICECGKKIYYGEDVKLTEEHKAFIKQLVEPYPYIFRSAIEKVIS